MSWNSEDYSNTVLGVWAPTNLGSLKDYKYTNDPIEMQEMICSHPKDHVLAYTSNEAIRILHEREGIVSPLCKWRSWSGGSISQSSLTCIDADAEPEVIAQYLKEHNGESFPVRGNGGRDWHDEWRKHGIAKNRDGCIRYDPKATKSARKYNPEVKQKWREKTGNFNHYSLCHLQSIFITALQKQMGCLIKPRGRKQSSEEIEAGVCALIAGINRVGVHHLFPIEIELVNGSWEYKKNIKRFVIYVDPPTYKEFQEEGTPRRSILDFVRSEATRCGFITESNDSESVENAKQ